MPSLSSLLTDAQLRALHDLIQSYHNAIVYNTIKTKGFLTEEDIDDLEKKGLIDPSLRNPLLDAYKFGKIQHILGQKTARTMSYERFKKFLSMNPLPLSTIEVAAIRSVNKIASNYIAQTLSERVKTNLTATVYDVEREMVADALRDVLPTNIKRRESLNKLASKLREQVKGYDDDFLRIAHTEKHNAMQAGVASEMYKIDPDIDVVKIPAADACKYCKALFLNKDGTLKVFKLKDIANNSNVGKKRAQWKPTQGTVHPWCGCQLARIPKGFWWNPKTRFVEPLVKSRPQLQKGGTYKYDYSFAGHLDTDKESKLEPLDYMLKGLAFENQMFGGHCGR